MLKYLLQRRIFTLFFWGYGAFYAVPAHADLFFHAWENHYEPAKQLTLLPRLGYFVSKSNYAADGSSIIPNGFNSYQRTQVDLDGGYGLNPYITLYGRINWARAQIDHTGLSGDSFGAGDQSLGAVVHVFDTNPLAPHLGLTLDVQLQADLAAYSNPNAAASGSPFLGDGTQDFMTGAFVTYPVLKTQLGVGLLTGGVAYQHRSAGFAAQVPWSIFFKYIPQSSGLFLHIGAFGMRPLQTNASDLVIAGSFGAGGSFAVNSIDPALLTLKGELGYQFNSKLALFGSVSQTLWGQVAPNVFGIATGVRMRWNSDDHKPPIVQDPTEYGHSNQGFVDYGNFEAKIIQTNDRLNLIKIGKGSQDGVEVGQIFDIFAVRIDGKTEEAIARARCTQIRDHEAALQITEYFREVLIEKDFTVKRPLR